MFVVKRLHLIQIYSIMISFYVIKLNGCRRLCPLFHAFRGLFMELMEQARFFFSGWTVLLAKVVRLLGSFAQFRCFLIGPTCPVSSRKPVESSWTLIHILHRWANAAAYVLTKIILRQRITYPRYSTWHYSLRVINIYD